MLGGMIKVLLISILSMVTKFVLASLAPLMIQLLCLQIFFAISCLWIWSTRHWTGAGSGLLISMLEKCNWFCLTGLITQVLLMVKWMGLFLRKNLLRCWGWLSLPNWIGAHSYLYSYNCLQENWRLDLFCEVSFSWGCSVSL